MQWRTLVERGGELIGLTLFFLIIVVQVLLGTEVESIVFNKVISIVDISLVLREYKPVLVWGLIMIVAALVLLRLRYRYQGEQEGVWYLHLGSRLLTGWMIGEWLIFTSINSEFYRNAVLTYPYLLGMLILLLLVVSTIFDTELQWKAETSTEGTVNRDLKQFLRPARYLAIAVLALVIIMPNLGPLVTTQPTPPDLPEIGGQPGAYDVDRFRLDHSVPANISSYLVPDNDNSSWYSFVYLPQVENNTELPVVIYAHGYTGTDPTDYENSLFQLASRGTAVIFVQYATDVELDAPFEEDPEETNFTASNAMYFRYLMVWNGVIQAVEDLVQDYQLNTRYVQIIGHSVGGGMVPYLATQVIRNGWGGSQLILDMETPWYASEHPLVQYDLSLLPDNTLVNIVGTQDDHLASPCIGMQHFERFIPELPRSQLAYLIIPSDFYGFPRLVATHYVVTAALDDTLTRWGYMKRVDAMSIYLVAMANGEDGQEYLDYFIGGGQQMLTQGSWSDGTPVNPLIYSQDPFGIRGGQNIASPFIDSHDKGPELCQR